MEKNEKVKVVFEFGRKEYDRVLSLLGMEEDEDSEEIWDAMTKEPVAGNMDVLGDEGLQGLAMVVAVAMKVTMQEQVRRILNGLCAKEGGCHGTGS